jgi:hypothetical protein
MKENRPTHQEIAARAYQIFLERGRAHGHDRDDWLQAEYELMQLPVRKIAELSAAKKPDEKIKLSSIINVVQTALAPDLKPREESSARFSRA